MPDSYLNYDSPLIWKCNNPSHTPFTGGFGLVDKNSWCPRCVGKFSKEEFLEKAQNYAISRGGSCLSTEYINSMKKLDWKCIVEDHPIWHARINILKKKNWCPKCGLRKAKS